MLIQVFEIITVNELGALEVEVLLEALHLRLKVVGAERERVVIVADDLRGEVIYGRNGGHRGHGESGRLAALA